MAADYLESTLLRAAGFRHAFFTRRGGASSGAYSSLNFSVSVGDEPGLVEENYSRAGQVLGVPGARIAVLSQVHGNRAVVLDESDAAKADLRSATLEQEGDALLTRVPGVACAVRTADCVPILVADRQSGAVSAIHAGWRGIVRGVVEAAVDGLRQLAGGRSDLIAAIGPHIGLAAFETGDDVAEELEKSSGAVGAVLRTEGQKPRVALARIVRAQLEAAGISRTQIDELAGCTLSDPERFFSYRRDGQKSGRHLSAIVPRP